MTLRAVSHLPANHGKGKPIDTITLTSEQRRLRRKVLTLPKVGDVMIDFAEPATIEHFGALVLEDGRLIEVVAAPEPLLEVAGKSGEHLIELAWHIGNRHMPAQMEKKRILVPRDRIAKTMLEGLGATVRETVETFSPARGAYEGHAH